jgi:hypothetical protein
MDPGGTLPYTGTNIPDSAQAFFVSPQPQVAAALEPQTAENDSQALLKLMILGMLALPGILLLTLIATVLIRR